MPHSETNPGDLPDGCGFLSQFGRSEESTEWHSPAPAGYQRGRTKFVVVIGTVMSGLGKGIFASSLAKLIKDKGKITTLKKEVLYQDLLTQSDIHIQRDHFENALRDLQEDDFLIITDQIIRILSN